MPLKKLSHPLDSAACSSSRPFDFRAWLDAWQEDLVFFRADAADRIEFVTDSVRAILGHEPDDLLGCNYREIFDVDHDLCAQLLDLSNRMLAHDSPESKRCVAQRRDGKHVFFLLRERELSDAVGRYQGKEVMALEVTRRVEAELWLRQSERKYRRLVEGFRGDYIIYTRDARGLITYVSPSVESVLGYPRDEVAGRNWRDIAGFQTDKFPNIVVRGDADELNRHVRQVVVETRRRDGSTCVLEVQEWSIFGIDGGCLAMEGIAKDVTAARQAELDVRSLKDDLERRVALRTEELQRINEELRTSEARYRKVVETQSEFIVRWKPNGERTFVNEPYCRFLGFAAEELLNSSVMPAIHPDDRHLVAEFIAAVTPENPTQTGEARLFAADGSVRWTQWSSQGYFDEHGQAIEYQSVGRDVTELKEAADLLRQKEAHLAHLSRLATMGEMVAGIAHELSQPLHAAKTFAEAARRHLESRRATSVASAVECCNEISYAILRTVEIIRRLREFTKASPVNIEVLDLNEVVRGAVEMMLYEIRRVNAKLHIDLADDLPPVEGDRIQLEQVCVNLLKNACDALEDAPPGKCFLKVSTAIVDGRVRLAIKDSGCGLGAADPNRLFDAFYSTKPDGMGMGLSLCKSIAEAHNMQLGFAPNEDQPGTIFHVTLPPAAARMP
jgi:PAS domain S-box-containing protein